MGYGKIKSATFYAGIAPTTIGKLWNTNFSEENKVDERRKLWSVPTVRAKSTSQDRTAKAISTVAQDVGP